MQDIIRIGTVLKVNYLNGTVDITYPDRDNSTSFDIPLLSFEYDPPDKGDMVLVIFLANAMEKGFVIGKPFNKNNKPRNGNKGIVRKDFDSSSFMEYNKTTKTLTINADNLVINGNLNIKGNLDVTGTIN
jgi:phage baseplate assembly protein gpV